MSDVLCACFSFRIIEVNFEVSLKWVCVCYKWEYSSFGL